MTEACFACDAPRSVDGPQCDTSSEIRRSGRRALFAPFSEASYVYTARCSAQPVNSTVDLALAFSAADAVFDQELKLQSPNSEADPMYSPSELANFKYAPITSVDVERIYQILKHVMNDRRLNSSFEI